MQFLVLPVLITWLATVGSHCIIDPSTTLTKQCISLTCVITIVRWRQNGRRVRFRNCYSIKNSWITQRITRVFRHYHAYSMQSFFLIFNMLEITMLFIFMNFFINKNIMDGKSINTINKCLYIFVVVVSTSSPRVPVDGFLHQ
jgi:hypothetical protein